MRILLVLGALALLVAGVSIARADECRRNWAEDRPGLTESGYVIAEAPADMVVLIQRNYDAKEPVTAYVFTTVAFMAAPSGAQVIVLVTGGSCVVDVLAATPDVLRELLKDDGA